MERKKVAHLCGLDDQRKRLGTNLWQVANKPAHLSSVRLPRHRHKMPAFTVLAKSNTLTSSFKAFLFARGDVLHSGGIATSSSSGAPSEPLLSLACRMSYGLRYYRGLYDSRGSKGPETCKKPRRTKLEPLSCRPQTATSDLRRRVGLLVDSFRAQV